MAGELRVVPDALSRVGHEMADHGKSLGALQRACRGEVQQAQQGWVGSSSGALSELLDSWSRTSTAHVGRFGTHADEIHSAAAAFAYLEQRNAMALAALGRPSDGEGRSAT